MSVRNLLVTNDFPPKVGGIQSYLWELWRRLPADRTAILTRDQPGARAFDAAAPMPVHRIKAPVLLSTRRTATAIDRLAAEVNADLVVLDPALPLGLVGPLSRASVRGRRARCRVDGGGAFADHV